MPAADGDALVAALDRLHRLCAADDAERVRALQERLAAGELRVLLVGESKRGKSTLGNALLGREVFPAGVTPVTAIATEVRQGQPESAKIWFRDGRLLTTNLDKVACYVSERHNPSNTKGVDSVSVTVAAGLPHPRVVLIDTPGVGSVLSHNTTEAESALERLDATIFVLTADPPISATEAALLQQVDALAARSFIVLNKADLLTPGELEEARGFTAGVVGGLLGREPDLWTVSARGGLQARLTGNDSDWRASGVAALQATLSAHLNENRTADLHASIAGAARRMTADLVDRGKVALATLAAVVGNDEERLALFGHRLDDMDASQEEALAILTATMKRLRAELDEEATKRISSITRGVRRELEQMLADPAQPDASALEGSARALISAHVSSAVESWRDDWQSRLGESIARLGRRHQQMLDDASGKLRRATEELLGVRLATTVTVLPPPQLAGLRYDFDPEVGWNQALVSGVRSRLPGKSGRRRIADHLRSECDRLVDKNVGRARSDLQARLEETERTMSRQVAEAIDRQVRGLRDAQDRALNVSRRSWTDNMRARERIEQQTSGLAKVLADLDRITGHGGDHR